MDITFRALKVEFVVNTLKGNIYRFWPLNLLERMGVLTMRIGLRHIDEAYEDWLYVWDVDAKIINDTYWEFIKFLHFKDSRLDTGNPEHDKCGDRVEIKVAKPADPQNNIAVELNRLGIVKNIDHIFTEY